MAFRQSTGLRNALAANRSYPVRLVTGTTYSFEDGTGTDGRDRIADSGSGFVTAGFVAGDYISVVGSTSNDSSGLKVLAVAAGYLEVAAGSFTTEAAGDQVIIGAGSAGGSYAEIFKNGVLDFYSGTQPATADAAETGTKLLSVTVASGAFVGGTATNGLNFDAAGVASGVVTKDSSTWSGAALADGTLGWWRFYANAYTTGTSTTAVRMDGSVATSGAQITVSATAVETSQTVTVDTFTITVPAS